MDLADGVPSVPQGLDQQRESLTRKDARSCAMSAPPEVDLALVRTNAVAASSMNLDEVMEPGLREILRDAPAWVRNIITSTLNEEVSRSFQNVVGQIVAVKEIMREVKETLSSSADASAVDNLLKDFHPSNIAALQRAADGVRQNTTALRNALEAGDLQTAKRNADQIATRAKRFRDKYAELRPHLTSLHAKLQELAKKCEQQESKSAELIAETERRREWWWRILAFTNCIMVAGSSVMLGLGVLASRSAAATAMAAEAATAEAAATAASAATAAQVGAPVATALDSILASIGVSGIGISVGGTVPLATGVIGTAVAAGAMILWQALMPAAATAGTAGATAGATAVAVAEAAAVTSIATTFVAPAALLALGVLGYVDRDRVKSLLRRLWESEIRQHEQSKEWFGHMKQRLREAAKKLRTVQERSEALETCLDLVVQTAEEISETAEDAQLVPNGHATDALREQIDRLCSRCNDIPRAFEELQKAARELETAARPVQLALPAPLELLDAGNDNQIILQARVQAEADEGALSTVREPAPLVSTPALEGSIQEVDESASTVVSDGSDADDVGWILVESPPNSTGRDCLPRSTGLLVTAESAATAGSLLAVGPGSTVWVRVRPQTSAQRLMATFSLGGHQHCLTADHPLRVLRSESWIQEHASMLRAGDVISTSSGPQVLDLAPRVQESVEQVYSLEVSSAPGGSEEVYVFTPNRGIGGHGPLHGVAVLGSLHEEGSSIRAISAPAGSDLEGLPSRGSLRCKGGAQCSNVCRKFLNGRCSEGRDCRFCHQAHSQERRRASRGARTSRTESRSSNSA